MHEIWVSFFLELFTEAADCLSITAQRILRFQEQYREKIQGKKRRTILASTYLDHLFVSPCVSIPEMATRLGIAFPNASAITKEFVEEGILKEKGGKGRNRVFIFDKYISALGRK